MKGKDSIKEKDPPRKQGIEQSGSGNAGLGARWPGLSQCLCYQLSLWLWEAHLPSSCKRPMMGWPPSPARALLPLFTPHICMLWGLQGISSFLAQIIMMVGDMRKQGCNKDCG